MFDALGHIEMGDEAHVRFVYTHTEGNGGDDDNVVSRVKRRWFASRTSMLAGMVGESRPIRFRRGIGRCLRLLRLRQ